MSLLILLLGIVFLLFLIIKFKLNTFISLIIVSFLVGIALGIDFWKIPLSIEKGLGSTLGELSIVFGFGSIIGRLVSDSGGSNVISSKLIDVFGKKRVQTAVIITSFIIGISMFFEVGLVILSPIVFTIATEVGVPFLLLGLPMVTALSVTHGFLPPHPAPTAISGILGANSGQVMVVGLIVALPILYLIGIKYSTLMYKHYPKPFKMNIHPSFLEDDVSTEHEKDSKDSEKKPTFFIAILTSIFPVLLMIITTLFNLFVNNGMQPKNPTGFNSFMTMLSNPATSMTISLIFATWSMGFSLKRTTTQISDTVVSAVKSIAMLLLIIGGGAAFKQILLDGGVSQDISTLFINTSLSPLIIAWLTTMILRISLGSSTVASITTAGLIQPLMVASQINPILMVLAIGAGSVGGSHVNDSGFWMFKEYFNLTIDETFKTWTVLGFAISIIGIIIVMILNIFM